jgi:hypothetical protein
VLARINLYSTMCKHVVVMRRYALRTGKEELVGESSNIKIEPEASASKVRPQHASPLPLLVHSSVSNRRVEIFSPDHPTSMPKCAS